MNAKISVFVICVEAIIYLSLHTLHDSLSYSENKHCTMNIEASFIIALQS